MSSVNYTLEHFYYGQVESGKGELQLLASSPGVEPEQIAEVVKHALVPPLVGSPTASWALVRGKKTLQFVLVQSQATAAGQATLHFILMPSDTLRSIGGNLTAMMSLLENPMTSYTQTGGKLQPLTFAQPEAQTVDAQIDDILSLMTYTKNQMDTISTLLAGIVQGVPLVIQGAPPEIEPRVTFIMGLLALLPASARYGVTFATHTLESTQVDTQIRFYGGEKLSRETLVYSWPRGKVGGKVLEDDYSRFIISQLRLDAELVSRQTRRLTGVAAWRIRRGETLAEALSYGAYRLKLDDALLNNQPVEVADVSKVLAEDPTLTDDLKIAYTRHLLAFALALGEMSHADPIAVMLRQQPDLELALQKQFGDAIQEGKAGLVYETCSRWLSNPLGPVGMKWVELTHRAALAQADALAKARDVKGLNNFLEHLQRADAGVEISRVVPKVIEVALPLTLLDRDLNLTVFLLAVNYLDSSVLSRIVANQKFTAQLPAGFSRFTPYLTGEDAGMVPAGMLLGAASAFGDEWRDLILIRLAELAVRANRPDAVDTTALSAMVGMMSSQWGLQYGQTLTWIAKNMSTDETLLQLDAPGPTYILQILLAFGDYSSLANEMLHQARLLYPGDAQNAYVATVRRLFAETAIPVEQVPVALKAINDGGIRSLPLATAYIGALEGQEWSSELDPVSEEATKMLFENPALLEVIQPSAMIALLRFHIKRKDVNSTIRVASLLPQVAARDSSKGINLIGRMYKMMDWDERVKMAALELLRRYVRNSDDEESRRAIAAFGREFGIGVQQALEATYSIKRMLDGVDLVDYADFLHITADFLYDTAVAYADKSKIPSIGALYNNMDGMTGGLNDDDRNTIGNELVALGKAILVLGDQAKASRPRDLDKHIENLLNNKIPPICVLDVFWIMGGYFTKGKRYPLKLEKALSKNALGERSAPTLRDAAKIANGVLRGAIRAFPPDKKITLSIEALRGELESLWGDIPLTKQREIVRDLAVDLQRTSELTAIIAADGTDKAMEDSGLARKLEDNKQQPRNTLEMYRFVSGYFKARTK